MRLRIGSTISCCLYVARAGTVEYVAIEAALLRKCAETMCLRGRENILCRSIVGFVRHSNQQGASVSSPPQNRNCASIKRGLERIWDLTVVSKNCYTKTALLPLLRYGKYVRSRSSSHTLTQFFSNRVPHNTAWGSERNSGISTRVF
jgi:hypothetical protein